MKNRKIFSCIGIFLILLYSFSSSLVGVLFQARVPAVMYILALVFIAIGSFDLVLAKRRKLLFFIIFILICVVLFRNVDLKNTSLSGPIFTCICLLTIPMLSMSDSYDKFLIKTIRFFTTLHIIGTFFCALFPEFYRQNIMPLFPDYATELSSQFSKGQIAGFTHHYSTNGAYLVIGLILNVSLILCGHRTKNDIMLLIFNSLALLLTGKRGMVLYFLIAFVVIETIRYRFHVIRLIRNSFIPILISSGVVLFVSLMYPAILNSFSRIIDGFSDDSVLDSRDILWGVALDALHGNEVFGIGWGGYKYYYEDNAIYKEREQMQVHNMYLQLLCETGIIGLVITILCFVMLTVCSIKDCVKNPKNIIISFFAFFNIYFLLEGVTGNSIYDIQFFAPYCLLCGVYLYEHYACRGGSDNKTIHTE